MYKFVAGFALMSLIFWSCKEELNKTGYGLLDKGDLVSVKKTEIDQSTIKSFTVTDEKQRTNETTNNLLGTFNDPVFGKITADFAVQFRVQSFPVFLPDAIIDSLVYYVGYKEIYGDTLTPQKLKVYELESDLMSGIADINYKYYQDENLKALAKPEALAEMDYIPRHKDTLNTTSTTKTRVTVEQVIAFHLNHSLARKLMALGSATLSDNDLFIKHFKGLYVEAGDINQGGTIMKVEGSGLVLYYRQEKDQVRDTIAYTFYVTKNSARVNRFSHDYSNTAFAANLDKKETQDSLIYLQTTGGLASKISIPNLNFWRDSANIAINKAELIFQVDQFYTDTANYTPPYQVILSAINEKDSLYFPSDLAFSQEYFGGVYNKTDGTYRFNIAKHMQELITRKPNGVGYLRENFGFFLSMADRNTNYGRVVLKGANSKTGIRLEITYSKIN